MLQAQRCANMPMLGPQDKSQTTATNSLPDKHNSPQHVVAHKQAIMIVFDVTLQHSCKPHHAQTTVSVKIHASIIQDSLWPVVVAAFIARHSDSGRTPAAALLHHLICLGTSSTSCNCVDVPGCNHACWNLQLHLRQPWDLTIPHRQPHAFALWCLL